MSVRRVGVSAFSDIDLASTGMRSGLAGCIIFISMDASSTVHISEGNMLPRPNSEDAYTPEFLDRSAANQKIEKGSFLQRSSSPPRMHLLSRKKRTQDVY
jgi:hypothetical protein